MKKKITDQETFQNFREWLKSNEGLRSSNVDGIISRIRSLENILAETYVEGEKVGLLHSLYTDLHNSKKHSGKTLVSEFKRIKGALNKANAALNGKKGDLKNQPQNITKYRSVLNAYIRFLEFMFPEFRKFNTPTDTDDKIYGLQRLTIDSFKKGIVGLLRKSKVIFSADSETITISMGTLQKILDDYANLHGAKNCDDLFKLTSLITLDTNPVVLDWEVALAENMAITVDRKPVNDPDVSELCFNPLEGSLEIYYGDYYMDSLELPSFAIENSIDNELSVHVMAQPSIAKQVDLFNKLRGVCFSMKEEMRPYIKIKGKKVKEVGYEDKLAVAVASINYDKLMNLAKYAYGLLREYGDGFHIELAIQ